MAVGGLDTDAQEAEARLRQYGVPHTQGGLDDDRCSAVGPDVAPDDPLVPGPHRPGGHHVVQLPEVEHLAAYHPSDPGHVGQPDGDDHAVEVVPQGHGQPQGQDEPGEGHQGVNQPHGHVVHHAAEVPRAEPDGHPHEDTQADGSHADPQGDASPEDDAAQDVPAQVVCAQGVGPGGGLSRQQDELLLGLVRRQPRREGRRHDASEDEGQAKPRQAHPQQASSRCQQRRRGCPPDYHPGDVGAHSHPHPSGTVFWGPVPRTPGRSGGSPSSPRGLR